MSENTAELGCVYAHPIILIISGAHKSGTCLT